MTDTKHAYGRREAAAKASVSTFVIDRAIGSGALKAHKSTVDKDGNPAGKLIILAADLDAWLENLPAA